MKNFCPSLVCADFSNLAKEIHELEKSGANMFHIDIMDGNFVANFSMGTEDLKAIQKIAMIPFDAHLAIINPDRYIKYFTKLGCEIIYIHAEATQHLHRSIMTIKEQNIKVGVALNPGTSIFILDEVLHLIDIVLVMSVEPGFSRQKFIYQTYDKINRLHAIIKNNGYKTKIAIDGAINEDVVHKLKNEVDYFILGTAGLFRNDRTYSESMTIFKNIVEK